MLGDAGALSECEVNMPITPLSICAALDMVEPEIVGLQEKS